MSNDGGPAFPIDDPKRGMSLLDYFAAKAMAAILARDEAFDELGETTIAQMAYDQAEAMLAYRSELDTLAAESQQVALGIGGEK